MEEFVSHEKLRVIEMDIFVAGDDILWDGIRDSYRLERVPLRPIYDVYPPRLAEREQAELKRTVEAVRIVGATLFCQAILVLLFIYHFQMGRKGLSLFISGCKELVCPLGITFLAVYVMNDPAGLWTGLALSYPVALAIVGLVIYFRCGRESFPFLLPKEEDDAILNYDFVAGPETAVALSKEAIDVLAAKGYPKDTGALVGAILEDAVMLIWEKNRETAKPTKVECTIIPEFPGIRLILRDSGVIFDFTDEDSAVESFRQFFLAYVVSLASYKAQITTTGYSRHIVVMPRNAGQRDASPAPNE